MLRTTNLIDAAWTDDDLLCAAVIPWNYCTWVTYPVDTQMKQLECFPTTCQFAFQCQSGNLAMTDGELHEIASNCHELKHLCMTECSNHTITDAGMEELFAGCPLLEYLHVGTAPNYNAHFTSHRATQDVMEEVAWVPDSLPAFGEEGLRQLRDMLRQFLCWVLTACL